MPSSTFPPEELKTIVQEVATLLRERSETISVAETVTCTPLPSCCTITNATYRQLAASSQLPSCPSPVPRSTTRVASHSIRWSLALPLLGGHLSTSKTTRDLRPTSSPDSPNTRARHWEARTRSARVAPRGQQAVRREIGRLATWHLPLREMVGIQ